MIYWIYCDYFWVNYTDLTVLPHHLGNHGQMAQDYNANVQEVSNVPGHAPQAAETNHNPAAWRNDVEKRMWVPFDPQFVAMKIVCLHHNLSTS